MVEVDDQSLPKDCVSLFLVIDDHPRNCGWTSHIISPGPATRNPQPASRTSHVRHAKYTKVLPAISSPSLHLSHLSLIVVGKNIADPFPKPTTSHSLHISTGHPTNMAPKIAIVFVSRPMVAPHSEWDLTAQRRAYIRHFFCTEN